ncbi:MAG TPA: hypothetical protein GXZ61_06300 [Clostridiales bacterium]|jgi:hypothetical protein|nr:hypothetical protein [Clostridiales bacterium]
MTKNTNENLHKGHRQRVFNSILSGGYKNAYSHQLLEALLMYSIPRGDTNPTAHLLIDRFKTLEGVFSASDEELLSIKGVGRRSVELLRAVGKVYSYLNEYENTHRFRIVSFECLTDLLLEYLHIQGVNIFFITQELSLENVISLDTVSQAAFSELVDSLQTMLSNDAHCYFIAYSRKDFDPAVFIDEVNTVFEEMKAYGFTMLDCFLLKDSKVYRPFNDFFEIVLYKIQKMSEIPQTELTESIFEKTVLYKMLESVKNEQDVEIESGDIDYTL